MEKGQVRNGKRTRRTRQQILEDEAALAHTSSSSSVGGGSDGGVSLNQKKSLRIMFQDAKSGKLGRKSKSKISKYVWPRTVESTASPFEDQSGKNKLFYLISIEIIQPSDTESEDEENYDPVNVMTDDSPSRAVAMPYFRSRNSGSNGPVYADVDDNDESQIRDDRSPSPASPKVRRGRRPTNARRVPYGRANE